MRKLSLPRFSPVAALLLSAALCPAAAQAQAQFTFGPRLGAGFSSMRLPTALPADTRLKPLAAYQLGVMTQLRYHSVALQSGLLYSTRGYQASSTYSFTAGQRPVEAASSSRIRYTYLEVPLHLAYSPAAARGLQVFAGAYGSVGVGGRQHDEYQQFDEQGNYLGTQVNDAPVRYAGILFQTSGPRTFDYGLNAGLGYERGRWLAQAQYSWGLSNLYAATKTDELRQYHRAASVTLTYWLLAPTKP
ncbi:porin family protein [Hymenobacter edaphi]|uniref:Outer membrane protein beta-barrel domain-containing protein n=1 Tax=Hymenobacter edaphi TaxID=2211146 RepID=A0A328BK23_9BACT|nr:porin family protein [Hymenobacter edaphi]RAK66979.1 hypothetical protein DLM85_12305 [Hymenobacter edaphi]